RLNRERKRVVVRMHQKDPGEDGLCTADWVRRTFTVAVARADLKPPGPRALKVRPRRIEDPTS
nr:hypothetical protein [Actinomycetota bacterium]